MKIYDKITDKLAGYWKWLAVNNLDGYYIFIKLMELSCSALKSNCIVMTITAFMISFVSYTLLTKDNPRWFSISIPLDFEQLHILWAGLIIYYMIVLLIRILSNIIMDSTRKYVANNPQIFDQYSDL